MFTALLVSATVASVAGSVDIAAPMMGKTIPRQYIVSFKSNDIGTAEANHIAKMTQFAGVNQRYQWDMQTLAGYSVGNCSDVALSAIVSDPLVKGVESDQYVYALGNKAADCESQTQTQYYNLARTSQTGAIDGSAAYKYEKFSATDDETIVYVADTGVRTTHVEFEGRAESGCNTINDPTCSSSSHNSEDDNGHGTHCAGTVAGVNAGAAKQVRIIAQKCLNAQGSGSYDQVIRGVAWCVEDHIDRNSANGRPAVLSMSLGGGFSQAMNDAIQDAVAANLLVSAAAGNNNGDACATSPASTPAATTVASSNNRDIRSSFSNYGECVTLIAPGESIRSAYYTSDNAYSTLSGTSMAAPLVAGVAAIKISENPSIKASALKELMQEESNKELVDLVCTNNACRQTLNQLAYSGTCNTQQ